MENPELKERPDDYIAEIRDEIENAAENIQKEFAGTNNTWVLCFVTRLTVVKGAAQLGERAMQISQEKCGQIKSIVDALNVKAREYQNQLPKGQEVSEEVKEELLAGLNSILEVL